MTPQHAKELLPIIQAFAEGKTIQCLLSPTIPSFAHITPDETWEWVDLKSGTFDLPSSRYRIKPTPPQEPNYGEICKETWNSTPPGSWPPSSSARGAAAWARAADAVIKAYKAHQQALANFEGNT